VPNVNEFSILQTQLIPNSTVMDMIARFPMLVKLFKVTKCLFVDHMLVDAGSCPVTGRTYKLCTRCEQMIDVGRSVV
jgi:hypothetical protein